MYNCTTMKPTPTSNIPAVKQELPFYNNFFYTRNCLELSTTFYIGVQYNKLPPLQDLYLALANLVESAPPLGLQVFSEREIHPHDTRISTKVFAAQLRELDFSKVVRIVPNLEINEKSTVDLLLGQKFEYGRSDKPLWEVIIMKDNWLVVNFDHTLLDGISGVNVHKHIINFLNNNSSTTKKLKETTIYRPKIFKSYRDFDIVNIYEDPIDSETSTKKYSLPDPLRVYQCDSKYRVKKQKFANNYLQINVPQSITSNLIKAGRNNGKVSLNTLICAVLCISTRNALVTDEVALKFFGPINARPMANEAPGRVGLMIKGMDIVTPVLSNSLLEGVHNQRFQEFWQFATHIQSEIADNILSTRGIQSTKLLSLVDSVSFLRAKEGQPAPSIFGFSNLGLQFQDFHDSNSTYRIGNSIFNQSNVISNIFTVSGIATLNKGTNLQFVYPDELKNEIEKVVTNFNKTIVLLENAYLT